MKNIKIIERILFIILLIIALLIVGYLIFNFVIKKSDTKYETELESEIKEYEYTSDTNSTDLYKDTFKELSDVLKEKTVDYDLYAQLISKLFIIDFYTLSNKPTKNDVGGTQFVHKDEVDNFILKATNTVYKYVESDLNGARKQILPTVKSIEIKDIKTVSYDYQDTTDDKSYSIELEWTYDEELGYDKVGTLILIRKDKKLYIVEKTKQE